MIYIYGILIQMALATNNLINNCEKMQQFAQYFGLQYKPSAGAEEGGRRGRERKTVMTINQNLRVWHTVRLGASKGMKAKMIEFYPTRKIPKKNLREYGHSPTL